MILPFEKTSLWQHSFVSNEFGTESESRLHLQTEFLDLRSRAEKLVALIVKDLPELTVHDITHLDALWEMASLVAGENYVLNPAEAFVFGGAIMLHDAAMCVAAFPRGLAEIKETNEWRDAVTIAHQLLAGEQPSQETILNPSIEVQLAALPGVLRSLHAKKARNLPMASWPLPNGQHEQIIRDADLRNSYGEIIGKLAESHWWPIEDLSGRLPGRVNAGPGVPAAWFVDPLKLACLLRVADAAHIDHRRAPQFLHALIKPSGLSKLHWTFQGKLGKPSVEHDKIVFTGTSFTLDEADSWWLCFDTVGLIDKELRSVDTLLQDQNRQRFAARAVSAAGSPAALCKFIGTDGWQPIDTGLRVSNVPDLVRLLGGEQLYGSDPTVPLREIIQNAADAIRAHRSLRNSGEEIGVIRVGLRFDSNFEWWLDVKDNGVGMSKRVLTETLLDFGRSLWGGDEVGLEFPGLISRGMRATGRFGIGFFSIFMLGDHVIVTTRRYDLAATETLTLDFRGGLDMRPILRKPHPNELLDECGARVSVKLRIPPDNLGGLCMRKKDYSSDEKVEFSHLVSNICPSVDVTVECYAEDKNHSAVNANDWMQIQGAKLLRRLRMKEQEDDELFGALLRELKSDDGRIYGRACVIPPGGSYSYGNQPGIVAVGGLKASNLYNIGGVLVGTPLTVSRNTAIPDAPAQVLRKWASEQASMLAGLGLSGYRKIQATAVILAFGGEIGNLPIVEKGGEYLNVEYLISEISASSELVVFDGFEIDYDDDDDDDDDDDVLPRDFNREFEQDIDIFMLPTRKTEMLRIGNISWPECVEGLFSDRPLLTYSDLFYSAVTTAWSTEPEISEERRTVGSVNGQDIVRRVRVFTRPI